MKPPNVIKETPSSLFFLHSASACGTNSAALPSNPNPNSTSKICFIGNPSSTAIRGYTGGSDHCKFAVLVSLKFTAVEAPPANAHCAAASGEEAWPI